MTPRPACPPGANRADEPVDMALRVSPDLRPGRQVMRLAVVEIVPLVGEQNPVRLGSRETLGQPSRHMLIVVRILVGQGRNLDQLGPAQPKHVLLFLALGIGNHDQRAVAARIGDERQPDAGIARRSLHDQPARLDVAARLRLQHHPKRRPVLHRLARIEEFRFCPEFRSPWPRWRAQGAPGACCRSTRSNRPELRVEHSPSGASNGLSTGWMSAEPSHGAERRQASGLDGAGRHGHRSVIGV